MKIKIMRFIIKHNTLYRFFSKFEWWNKATIKEARKILGIDFD